MPAIRHLCTAFAMLAFAGQAYAAPSCTWASTAGPLSYYIDLGAPWVARDAPIGTLIGTVQTFATPEVTGREIRCVNDGTGTLTFQASPTGALYPGPLPQVGPWDVNGKVMETGIMGVGLYIRLGFPFNGAGSNTFTPTDDVAIPYTGENNRDSGVTPLQIKELYSTMALIKTGPIPTGRQFFSGQMVRSQISFLGDALNIHVSGVVQQAHCTLLANPVSANPVQLGTYTLADFTGPGSYTDAKDFYVTLSDCRDDPAGGIASAYIRLEGAKGSVPLEPAQGVFSLDNKPGSATGIGIQLLRSNDSPMPLQQDEAVTPLVVDKTVLHFKARFFQTAPTVTAGPANGALDFTMTYR